MRDLNPTARIRATSAPCGKTWRIALTTDNGAPCRVDRQGGEVRRITYRPRCGRRTACEDVTGGRPTDENAENSAESARTSLRTR